MRWCTSHSVDKIRFLLGMLYRFCSPYLLWIQQRPESSVTIYFFTLNQGVSRRNTFLGILSTWYSIKLCDIPFSFNWAEAFRCISLGVLPNSNCCPTLIHKVHWVIDRMQKWLPINYSFIFVLISLTSLGCMRKIQKNFHTKTRLVSPISI